jgi:MFS family permease
LIAAFVPLYLSTILLQIGTGLLNTYVGLRLSGQAVSETWIGAMTAGHYLGQVCGGRLGHRLVIRVGHIRAFSACAAVATCAILGQGLTDLLPAWLVMRVLFGFMIVTQYMVLESWLNEQTENRLRGRVFSIYMVVSGLGTVMGQLILTVYDHAMDNRPFTLVAIFLSLCVAPLAARARSSPDAPKPARLELSYYLRQVPTAVLVLFVAGCIVGSFYSLSVVYMVRLDFSAAQSASFVAAASACGLLSQWPMGWLSDRFGRARLIRVNATILAALAVLLWGWAQWPYWLMLVLACVFGVLQFTLYPLGAALANDQVGPERRVSLSAVLLMAYGVGACAGPLAAGLLMSTVGPGAFYVFVSACALVLAWRARPAAAQAST